MLSCLNKSDWEMKTHELITVKAYGSISALGFEKEKILGNYRSTRAFLVSRAFNKILYPVAALADEAERFLAEFMNRDIKFMKRLDRSVLMAVASASLAFEASGWAAEKGPRSIGINLGSSRGATGLFERFHADYLKSPENRTALLTSPLTTLGNISSSAAHFLDLKGPIISHSMTCTTGAQAVINAVAWLRAGMADKFLAGGVGSATDEFHSGPARGPGNLLPRCQRPLSLQTLDPDR